MDFFDDDATSVAPPRDPSSSSPPRRRPDRRSDRRRTRIQRIVVLAAILFVVVFAAAWWARSCQHNRKVDTYRVYFDGVAAVINDSADLGKRLEAIVANPTKFSRKQLVARLEDMSSGQAEIAVRSDRLEPPDTLQVEQATLAEGMKVRAEGYRLLRSTMLAALANKKVGPRKLAALAGYFSGPDAYYMSRVYSQARTTLGEQGVTDVAVPTATYYLKSDTFDSTRLASMLSRVGSSSKLSGIHGVGVADIVAQPGDLTLARGKTTSVPATADLAFDVKVQNQGDVSEKNVPVTATLSLPGGATLKQSGTIATIAAGQTQAVRITGFAIPAEALSKTSTLKVKAGPVPGERVLTNNTGKFKILLQLQ